MSALVFPAHNLPWSRACSAPRWRSQPSKFNPATCLISQMSDTDIIFNPNNRANSPFTGDFVPYSTTLEPGTYDLRSITTDYPSPTKWTMHWDPTTHCYGSLRMFPHGA